MIWVTWRQHHLEGFWVLLAVALLAGCIGIVTYEAGLTSCSGARGGTCVPNDLVGYLAVFIMGVNLIHYPMVVFPALVGAFVGGPLLAREIENGTHRLAWTQGLTRTRWLFEKLGLIFVPLMVAAAVLGILEVNLISSQGPQANHWFWFDQQAPMVVGSTAFALALGVAAGSVLGKSVPAMAVSLVAFVVTRVGIAELARAHYLNPVLYKTNDPTALNGVLGADPTGWWLDQPDYHNAAGQLISGRSLDDLLAPTVNLSSPDRLTYYRDHGIFMWQYYQPADRFWTFESIETGILLILAAALLGFTAYWVTRRLS